MASWGRLKRINEPFYPSTYYAVGDLYLTTNSENPSIRLGYGTWLLFGPGRTIVCVDTSDSDFNTVKKTGGEKTHTLNINEMPAHSHNVGAMNNYDWGEGGDRFTINNPSIGYSVRPGGADNGGNQPHNNLQPFITCYIWIRTA